MAKTRALIGETPYECFSVREDGVALDPNEAIFPIVTQDESGLFRLIGTGFFISQNGIFVTAKHVVTEMLDTKGDPTGPFGIFQFLPDNHYYLRPIHRATHHEIADVAVGVAWPMHLNETDQPLINKLLTLASKPPETGAKVSSYAYPNTTIDSGLPQVISFNPNFFDGQIVEHFPNGRDRAVLPGACFHTSMVIQGGASGGPVIGPGGTVFGINSTGFDDESISYVSCISDVLDLQLTGIRLPGEVVPRSVTPRELSSRGFIVFR